MSIGVRLLLDTNLSAEMSWEGVCWVVLLNRAGRNLLAVRQLVRAKKYFPLRKIRIHMWNTMIRIVRNTYCEKNRISSNLKETTVILKFKLQC